MKNKDGILFPIIFGTLCLICTAECIKWLALTRAKYLWNETSHCPRNKQERQIYGLTGYQVKVCRRHTELMNAIVQAASSTQSVCMQQFADRRWNCSSVTKAPTLTPDLKKGTREQAYVYALSSAAIAHSVAIKCRQGSMVYCPCTQSNRFSSRKDENILNGCNDNIDYGIEVSKVFADAPWIRHRRSKKKKSILTPLVNFNDRKTMNAPIGRNRFKKWTPRTLMNQHNNVVGRKVIIAMQQTMKRKCKCHGVSGSCQKKTCFMVLPTMVEVAERLKIKYRDACEVRPRKKHTEYVELEAVARKSGTATDEDMIFIKKSPDFCTKDDRLGSVGTQGRQCNASRSLGHGDCASMCCGRGYTEIPAVITKQCYCKFQYCCKVVCKTCKEHVVLNFCK